MQNRLVAVALIAAVAVLTGCDTPNTPPWPPQSPQASTTTASPLFPAQQPKVVRVVDGDTIRVLIEGHEQTVRLIGIDTPETVHPTKPDECYGAEAAQAMRSYVDQQFVDLEADATQGETDRFGRLLRYVYVDGVNVNLSMIGTGYAFEYTFDEPYKYQDEFKAAEIMAMENELGLWADDTCDYSNQ